MRKNKARKKGKTAKILLSCILAAALGGIVFVGISLVQRLRWKDPQEILQEYMACIASQEYGKMYQMISKEESGGITEEEFIERNANIYEGIEAENIKIQLLDSGKEKDVVLYECTMDTIAGEIHFENSACFVEGESGYELVWEDSLIFPQLGPEDKVQVLTESAQRGKILDRNGKVFAGKGVASSVGLVPEKMEENSVKELAALLKIDEESIQTALSASWVSEDSFVPIKTIPKEGVPDVMDMLLGEAFAEEGSLEQALLQVPGVMITDVEVREYPLKEAAAHLVGYVQSVTAEDLKEHEGEGYTSGSVIGRSGMEGLYEERLRGKNGYKILIKDSHGNNKSLLAMTPVQDGEDIRLTIDAGLQETLYEQLSEDKSCSVAMNPYTGEVLALVSTPSYDNNGFIMGFSEEEWTALNEDENMPLYNRFRQTWCPGSVFKPIIASVGIDCNAIDPLADYGNEGTSWQKDESWGDYYVTTLHEYEPVTLKNALIYSDNIYYAKAALNIGADNLTKALKQLGFGADLPFEITMTRSQYSNTEEIQSEVQLADSGYGQGQILINPVHLAALYTAFLNQGDVLTPYLLYKEEPGTSVWLPQAFSTEAVQTVAEGMEQVINDPNGTGYGVHREDIRLAGKTGTAEIKVSVEDTTGTELGWLAVYTAQETENPLLLVSMVEDVKDRGGSGYVTDKIRAVLDTYFS